MEKTIRRAEHDELENTQVKGERQQWRLLQPIAAAPTQSSAFFFCQETHSPCRERKS
jgi:hypothetical protein